MTAVLQSAPGECVRISYGYTEEKERIGEEIDLEKDKRWEVLVGQQ
jgi:hypothetical protein